MWQPCCRAGGTEEGSRCPKGRPHSPWITRQVLPCVGAPTEGGRAHCRAATPEGSRRPTSPSSAPPEHPPAPRRGASRAALPQIWLPPVGPWSVVRVPKRRQGLHAGILGRRRVPAAYAAEVAIWRACRPAAERRSTVAHRASGGTWRERSPSPSGAAYSCPHAPNRSDRTSMSPLRGFRLSGFPSHGWRGRPRGCPSGRRQRLGSVAAPRLRQKPAAPTARRKFTACDTSTHTPNRGLLSRKRVPGLGACTTCRLGTRNPGAPAATNRRKRCFARVPRAPGDPRCAPQPCSTVLPSSA